jgi:hypothetical protein
MLIKAFKFRFPKEPTPCECFFMAFKLFISRRAGVGWHGGEAEERRRRLPAARRKNVL